MFKVGDKVRIVGFEISGFKHGCQEQKREAKGVITEVLVSTRSYAEVDINGRRLTFVNEELELASQPHKHAEAIKAWADGAKIETQNRVDQTWLINEDPRWDPNCYYRVYDEYRELKEAYEQGKPLEVCNKDGVWSKLQCPNWTAVPPSHYRIQALYKKAYNEGKYVQVKNSRGTWIKLENPARNREADAYRILKTRILHTNEGRILLHTYEGQAIAVELG